MDDILIATEVMQEHFDILQEIFEIVRKHRLQFRMDNCSFLYDQIIYEKILN